MAFDLDGVLLNSAPVHEWAFREVFQQVGITDFSYEQWAGMRTIDVVETVLANNHLALAADKSAQLAAMKSRLALARMSAAPPVASGCEAVLSLLHARVRLALASSASRSSVEMFLDRSNCRRLFSVVLSAENVGMAKPAPGIYIESCRRLDLAPTEVLVIEDSVQGIRAGTSAGCPVWAVRGTSCDSELLRAGASRVLNSVRDLVSEEALCDRAGSST